MKKLTRWAVCLGLCLALVVCGALAAESQISVQLDGQNLAFTDAVPQVKDQRTFLPFRAVFEAMDADVDYEGATITAVRGGKTLTMTVGSTQAAVTENGVTLPITMDVAPYVDAETWRTYVPVRFAAQAFDCAVGWDQAAQTAVIVDTEKLAAASMTGKSYTYLEKLAALGDKFRTGIWDMDTTFNMEAAAFAMPMMTVDGGVKGVMEDNAKMDMSMNMKLDMDGLMALVGSMGGQTLSPEDQAMLAALKTDGIDMTVRGDINTGKLYMNMDMGALAAQAGLDPAAWYELDMAALMAQSGMDWGQLMAMSENANLLDTLVSTLGTTAAPNSAATGYSELKAAFETLFAAFADDKFVPAGNTRTLTYDLPVDGGKAAMIFTLTVNGNEIADYTVTLQMDSGSNADGQSVAMDMTIYTTAEGKMSAELGMNAAGMFDLAMTMNGGYTPGSAAPVVTPPEGAKIVSFTDLMGQTGGFGAIGGADGPTSFFPTLG